ncbi:MAG: DUF4214 domain-containing protein [Pseudomonadota bacterium]
MPTESSLQMVQTLYIAYYGRAAEPEGLQFWAERLDEAGGDVSAILDDFGTSEEYTENFADLDSEALVNNLYLQLFGRDAEAEGLSGYVASLESGDVTLADIAAEIAGGAQGEDAQMLEAKREAADRFTEALAERPGGQQAYQGDAVQAAKDYLAQVTVSEQPDPAPVVDSLVSTASQAYVDDIQTLYVAYYGRPADAPGLAFWTEQALANDGDLTSLIQAFGTSDEYTQGLAQLEPEGQVTALYQQLFGRDPEAEGLTFYSEALESGALSLADIALEIASGAAADDEAVLNARVEVAKAITESLDTQEEQDQFATPEGQQAIKDLLSGVSSSDQAQELVDNVDEVVSESLGTAPSAVTVTLSDALDQAPESAYRLDASAAHQAGTVSVSQAQGVYAEVQALISGAQNTDELDIDSLLVWSVEDAAASLVAASQDAAVTGAETLSVTDDEITLGQAQALQALDNFDGNLPTVRYTLEEAQAADSLPSDYAIEAGAALQAGTLSVADAQSVYSDVAGLISAASNSDELDIADLLEWSIEDGVAAILDNSDEPAVAGAQSVSVTSDQVTLAQAESLQALDNFDGELPTVLYTLEQALNAEELPNDYALLDVPYEAGDRTVADAQTLRDNAQLIVDDAANADDLALDDLLSWSLLDSGEALLGAVGGQIFQQAEGFAFDSGDQVYVDNDGTVSGHDTLQGAIDAAQDGATLLLSAGDYSESVQINGKDDLTLLGANLGRAATGERNPESTLQGVLRIDNASGIEIDGLAIDGDGVVQDGNSLTQRGLNLGNTSPVSDISLENTLIQNWTTGVSPNAGEASNVVITGNAFLNNEAGIGSTDNSSGLSIFDNHFAGNDEGIGLGGGIGLLDEQEASVDEIIAYLADNNTFDVPQGAYAIGDHRPGSLTPSTYDADGNWFLADIDQLDEAVGVADEDSTLFVASGDYTDDVSVDVTGMTLNGANAGLAGNDQARVTESTIIGKLDVAASDITVDGFTIDNDNGYALSMSSGINLVFQNNIVTGDEGTKLDYYGGPNDTLVFQNNLFDGTGIGQTEDINGLNILGNTVLGENISVGSGADNVVIEGNTVTDNYSGFNIYSGAVTVEFADNNFEDVGSAVLFRNGNGDWNDGEFTFDLDQFRDEQDELLDGLIHAGKHDGGDQFDLSGDFNVAGFSVDAQGVVLDNDPGTDDVISWDGDAGTYEGLSITLTGVQVGDDIAGLFSGTNSDPMA